MRGSLAMPAVCVGHPEPVFPRGAVGDPLSLHGVMYRFIGHLLV